MSEFDLPIATLAPPPYEDQKTDQIRSDEEYARQLAREDSHSDSDIDAIKFQGSLLDDLNKERDDSIEKERNASREKEREQLRRESEQNIRERDQIKKSYDDARRERDQAQTQLYREKYDIDKERRLRNLGLNLIPSYSTVSKNFLDDKIENLVKRELKRGDDQKSESELMDLIKSLVEKSTTRRKHPIRRKPKKKSANKSKKKSANKSKKKK